MLMILFSLQALWISCDNNKNDVKDNPLMHTEWNDDSGTWFFAFNSPTEVDLTYNIPGMHAPLKRKLKYRVDGNKLVIDDYQETITMHENITTYLVKDFQGVIDDNTIVCDFKTPTTKVKDGESFPDLTILVDKHVLLKKKRY